MSLNEKSIPITISIFILAALSMFFNNRNYFTKPAPTYYCKIDTIKVSDQLKFPYVHCKDSIAEFKINAYLQLEYLGTIYPNFKDIFNNLSICPKKNRYKYLEFYFDILNNSANWLTVKIIDKYIDLELDSHIPQSSVVYFNFNPQNGDLYMFENFFDSANYIPVIKCIRNHDLQNYKKTGNKSIDDMNLRNLKFYYDSLYCSESYYKNHLRFYFKNEQFYLQNDSLFIELRKIPSYPLTIENHYFCKKQFRFIPINIFNSCFNDLGKAVINNNKDLKKYKSYFKFDWFFGEIKSIGKFNISFLNEEKFNKRSTVDLNDEGIIIINSEGVIQYYLGYSKINHFGLYLHENLKTIKGNIFYNENECLEFTKTGDTLIGTWISADKKKKLPFWAKRI